ncbi:MAG: response regulator transcription factor [Treponema sp.]|uniref:response regulator transcription factor n=1 Tax=Treponema sp. TaxID=166 RepID=UPI00298D6B1D|nr:response regulator transcription factor [Treponema sp.]MBR0154793.1 response regulator transcription factor [Treponema sp.]MCR5386663.1 response regulator transcription factor [Treponema sp.]
MEQNLEKVLIVEDDPGISEFIDLELKHEGFETCVANTGRKALEQFEKFNPNLILLDVMLPEISGLEVLRRIRKTSEVPVIMVTAKGDTYDRVNGLDAGADDYIPKPFEIEELLARMRAVLRRTTKENSSDSVLKIRDLEMIPQEMSVTLKGETLNLSKTEFFMLKKFMENPDTVFSRNDLIEAIWGAGHYIDINTIDVYIGYLRSKIDNSVKEEYIKTVRGCGYKMVTK